MKRTLFLLAFFVVPVVSLAQVKITEIFYDATGADEGHEWIEIQNISQNPLNLSDFRLYESGTNHKLIPVFDATTTPSQYVVIASNASIFKQDNPAFFGLLFDSTFSLSNTGESLSIKNSKGEVIDSVSYKASGTNGASLQFVDGVWQPSKPTPGAENKISAVQKTMPIIPEKPATVAKPKVTKNTTIESPVVPKSEFAPAKMIPLAEELPSNETSSLWVYILGLAIVILGGLFGVYLLENKGVKNTDTKKELSAEDFEIVEDKGI